MCFAVDHGKLDFSLSALLHFQYMLTHMQSKHTMDKLEYGFRSSFVPPSFKYLITQNAKLSNAVPLWDSNLISLVHGNVTKKKCVIYCTVCYGKITVLLRDSPVNPREQKH